MLRLIVLTIFTVISLAGYSQDKYREHLNYLLDQSDDDKALLLRLLSREKAPERKTIICFKLGEIYEEGPKIDTADFYFRKALKYAFQMGKENEEIGVAYKKVGKMCSYRGEYDSAIYYMKRSLPYLHDKKLIASSLNSMATMYKYKGEVDVAVENYLKSLVLFRELKDTINQSIIYSNIGALYRRIEEYDKSQEYLLRGIDLAQTNPDFVKAEFLCKSNLASTYLSQQKLKKAEELFLELVQFSREKQRYSELIVNQANLAACYSEMGRDKEALKQYESLLMVMNDMGLTKHKEALLVNMALSLKNLNRNEEALDCYHQALAIARTNNIYANFEPIFEGLSEIHRNLNNSDSSLYYKDLQLAVRDSLESLEREKKLMELEAKHRNKELDEDLKSTKSALDSAENEKSLFATGFAYAIIIIIVTVFVVVFLLVRYKRKKELAKELHEQNKQNESEISSLEHSLDDKTEEIERLREKGAVEKLEYPVNLAPLTEREKEVLFGVQEGLKDQEIADKLFISITTVRTHLRKAYVKVDARNRAEAIQFISKHKI